MLTQTDDRSIDDESDEDDVPEVLVSRKGDGTVALGALRVRAQTLRTTKSAARARQATPQGRAQAITGTGRS